MLNLPRFDGPLNMALDSELLNQAESETPGWRVYGWKGPWVSLGCYQRTESALRNPDGTNWVMRPTGGKAVLHGHDVTVGLALPLRSLPGDPERLARSIRTVYPLAIAPIVAALRECGLPAILAENLALFRGKRELGAARVADCFAFTSPNDIVHESTGEKVCGCALKLTRNAVLVQASIPAGPPLVDPSDVFEYPAILSSPAWNAEHFVEALDLAMRTIGGRDLPVEVV